MFNFVGGGGVGLWRKGSSKSKNGTLGEGQLLL